MPSTRDPFLNRSTGDLARILGLTERQVRNLVQNGMPHRKVGRVARFDLPECIPWVREMDRKPGGAREEVDRERAETLRFDRHVKEGLYVEAEYFDAVTDGLCKLFVDTLMAIPPRLKAHLSPEAMDALYAEVSDAREEVAAGVFRLELPAPMGNDTEAPAEEDDQPVGGAGKKATKRRPRARQVSSK